MSLTSFLRSPISRPFRDQLKVRWPRPEIELNGSEFVARKGEKGHSLIGTAFDYLLRFKLQRVYDQRVICRGGLIADATAVILNKYNHNFDAKKMEIPYGLEDLVLDIDLNNYNSLNRGLRKYFKSAAEAYCEAKRAVESYLSGRNSCLYDLANASLTFAKMDVWVRRRWLDPSLGYNQTNDAEELVELLDFNLDALVGSSGRIYLNPTFGKGSGLFGGADADIIVGSRLIDLKCSIHNKVTREHLNQLLSYTLASDYGKINGSKKIQLRSVAIFNPRYQSIWSQSLVKWSGKRERDNLQKWGPVKIDYCIRMRSALFSFDRSKPIAPVTGGELKEARRKGVPIQMTKGQAERINAQIDEAMKREGIR